MRGHRTLWLDGLPKEGISSLRIVQSREDIDSLYEERFKRLDTPNLVLDCRELKQQLFSLLLKFLEEYGGDVTLLARDPVPLPILSRFSEQRKVFEPKIGQLIEIRLKSVRGAVREKIYQLFGLELGEEKDDEL